MDNILLFIYLFIIYSKTFLIIAIFLLFLFCSFILFSYFPLLLLFLIIYFISSLFFLSLLSLSSLSSLFLPLPLSSLLSLFILPFHFLPLTLLLYPFPLFYCLSHPLLTPFFPSLFSNHNENEQIMKTKPNQRSSLRYFPPQVIFPQGIFSSSLGYFSSLSLPLGGVTLSPPSAAFPSSLG